MLREDVRLLSYCSQFLKATTQRFGCIETHRSPSGYWLNKRARVECSSHIDALKNGSVDYSMVESTRIVGILYTWYCIPCVCGNAHFTLIIIIWLIFYTQVVQTFLPRYHCSAYDVLIVLHKLCSQHCIVCIC